MREQADITTTGAREQKLPQLHVCEFDLAFLRPVRSYRTMVRRDDPDQRSTNVAHLVCKNRQLAPPQPIITSEHKSSAQPRHTVVALLATKRNLELSVLSDSLDRHEFGFAVRRHSNKPTSIVRFNHRADRTASALSSLPVQRAGKIQRVGDRQRSQT